MASATEVNAPSSEHRGRVLARERRAQLARHGRKAQGGRRDRVREESRKPTAGGTPAPSPASAPAPQKPKVRPVAVQPVASSASSGGRNFSTGRLRAMQHRDARTKGKHALGEEDFSVSDILPDRLSGRERSKAYRRARSQGMRALRQAQPSNGSTSTHAPASEPPPNPRNIDRPRKFDVTHSYGRQRVSGLRIGRSTNVTGDEPGECHTVTGTQYVTSEQISNLCTAPSPQTHQKVGASRTTGGQVVTGTQVRSRIAITGDEANKSIPITGEADQTLADDLVHEEDRGYGASAGSSLYGMGAPHAQSALARNVGRNVEVSGSRSREAYERAASELTLGGQNITGTALGRSSRVTGDEPGSCRQLTGTQYLMSANRQPMCGGEGVATTAPQKVSRAQTWGGQRVSGARVEQDPRVSGDEYGSCSDVSGTPYVGPGQYAGVCTTDERDNSGRRVTPQPTARIAVTGDLPGHGGLMTGAGRGTDQRLTGTAYQAREELRPAGAAGATDTESGEVLHAFDRFSVQSPQRAAFRRQLQNSDQHPQDDVPAITGSMAQGQGKITGNVEFDLASRGRSRSTPTSGNGPTVTGEGSMSGTSVTGDVWNRNLGITGTEGRSATVRNPSERGGRGQAFAGNRFFASKSRMDAVDDSPVTGSHGNTTRGAVVTASGGARS